MATKIRVLGNGNDDAHKDIEASLCLNHTSEQAKAFAESRGYERGVDDKGTYYVPDIPAGKSYAERVIH